METWLILAKEFTCRCLSIQSSSETRGNDGKLTLHNFRATMPQDLLMSHFPSKIRWTRPFPMPSKPTKHFGETQWPSKNHFLLPFDRGPTVCFTSGGVQSALVTLTCANRFGSKCHPQTSTIVSFIWFEIVETKLKVAMVF